MLRDAALRAAPQHEAGERLSEAADNVDRLRQSVTSGALRFWTGAADVHEQPEKIEPEWCAERERQRGHQPAHDRQQRDLTAAAPADRERAQAVPWSPSRRI